MRLNIRLTFNSKTETITVPDNLENVAALKTAVASQIADVGEFRLVFAGKVLKDEDNLGQSGVRDGVTVHLVRSKAPAKAPEPQQPAEPQAQPRQPNYYTGPIAGEQPQQQQNPNPQPNFGGMGGMGGFPDMSGMMNGMGGMGNIDGMMQMMQQNPEMLNQAIDFIAQNPAMLRQMLMNNPMTAQMMQNPQMSGMIDQMLSNPAMLRMMLNPQMLQMASQMGGMGGMPGMNGMGMGGMGMPQQQPQAPQQTQPQQPMNTQPQANPFGSLFGQPMNTVPQQQQQAPMYTQPQPQAPQQQRDPRDIYQTQLASLREMGFFDEQENIRALQRTGGNVNAAVELLLQGAVY